MESCLFCQIVKGESSAFTLYKDEIATAFLDVNPVTLGHVLVIPNKHYQQLHLIKDEEIMKRLMNVIIKVTNQLIKSGICRDYTILQDNGVNAQQDIMHAHFHIIPRHRDETVRFHLPADNKISSKESLKLVYNLLKGK